MCLAVPGKILSILDPDSPMRAGKVDFNGVAREVSLAFVPEAEVGSWVIVHAGSAISVLDEEEAQKTLEDLRAVDESLSSGETTR